MNDNETRFRVVESNVSDQKKALLNYLRDAMEVVENTDVAGIQISIVRADGDVITITSESNARHLMVAAAAYQLFDVIAAGAREA